MTDSRTFSSDVVCVLPHRHDPDRPRSAEDGIYVCRGCLGALEQALAEMPAHFDALARRLAPARGSGPMVTGTREKALPIDPTVAEHRSDIQGKLVSWSLLVAEERSKEWAGVDEDGELKDPTKRINPPHSPAPTVTATWLLVHLRWSCAQMWVDELAGELRALRGRSMSLLYPTGRRRVEVGPCIETECEGVLTSTISPADDLLPSVITCSVEPEHFWEAPEWHLLGRKMHGSEGFGSRVAEAFRS